MSDSVPPLPPWSSRNERERKWMVQWSLDRLEEPRKGQAIDDGDYHFAPVVKFNTKEAYHEAVRLAHRGDVEPLRRLIGMVFPEICEFIQPLPRVQGQRPPHADPFRHFVDSQIVDDVKRLREIWKAHFGRFKRRPDDGCSAEYIVALRWNKLFEGKGKYQTVDEDKVCDILKTASRRRIS
jgi:hypothetical protein